MTVAQAVSTIERGVNEFYLLDANGRRLEIAIEQGPRRKHLRARGGGKWLDDLLTLIEAIGAYVMTTTRLT